jgi:hypothetical protein
VYASAIKQYTLIQVADTRFAVWCSYPPFTRWLAERHAGFVAQGEPNLILKINMDCVPEDHGSSDLITVTAARDDDKPGELRLNVVCPRPDESFWLLLQICLQYALLAKRPPDLLLHSSGIIHEGSAYIFAGTSGAGKSTVCKILSPDPAFTVLHDETVAVSRTGEGFCAWSTPLRGEMPANCNSGAPLRAIFFLRHSQTNYTNRLSGRKAVGLLAACFVPPLVVVNNGLVSTPEESLNQLLMVAERVPCYELYFRPERSFWECIQQLPESSPQ